MFGGAEKTSPRTFNQTQPFDRLVGSRHSFSFDLKSATDRWPLVFLFEVVQYLFDRYFASSVVNSAFACNIFEVPFVKLKRRFSQVCFVAGQPLGISRFLAYFRAITPYISVVVCETGAPWPCLVYALHRTRYSVMMLSLPIRGNEFESITKPCPLMLYETELSVCICGKRPKRTETHF